MSMQPATTIFSPRIVALVAIGDREGLQNMEIPIQEVSKHLKGLSSRAWLMLCQDIELGEREDGILMEPVRAQTRNSLFSSSFPQ